MFGGQRLANLGQFSPEFPDAEALHRGLAHWNHRRMAVATPSADWRAEVAENLAKKAAEDSVVEPVETRVQSW